MRAFSRGFGPTIVLVLLIGLTLPRHARADILFIDMNINSKELQAARDAAKLRGEKLVVIPEISEEVRKQVTRLKTEKDIVQNKLEALIVQTGKLNDKLYDPTQNLTTAQKTVIEGKISAIQDQMAPLPSKIAALYAPLQALLNTDNYHVTGKKIDQVLSQYDKQGKQFDSFIISSHHIETFYSDFGSEITTAEIKSIFANHPKQQNGIASLYFWGCYNGAAPTMLAWRGTFPKAYVIAGWDGLAPEEHRAIDSEFLKDMMVKEKNISHITDLKKLMAQYQSIPGIRQSNASFCTKDVWVGIDGTVNLKELKCDSDYLQSIRETVSEQYLQYFYSSPKFPDVPADVHHSALRNIYSQLREAEECPGMTDQKNLVPQILNLIFFKTIEKNFQLYFQDDLAKANQILKTPYHLAFPDFSDPKVTRQQVLESINIFGTFLNGNSHGPLDSQTMTFLKNLRDHLEQNLRNMTGIDSTWLSDASSRNFLHAPTVTRESSPIVNPRPTPTR